MRDLSGVGIVTVGSVSHLAFVVVLREAVRRLHPELPFLALIADLRPGEPTPLALSEVVGAEEIGVPDLPWLALKLTMSELCCALKPFALRHAFERGLDAAVYLDADVDLHARLDALLAELQSHDLVATPHLLAAETSADRPDRFPTLAQVAAAGWINAGLFGIRNRDGVPTLLARWAEVVTRPGAFLAERGGLTEQQAFNQLLTLHDSVALLFDPGYNVAYWNLDERRLEGSRAEAGEERFFVDERPLVAFHWSGFDPARPAVLTGYHSTPWLERRPAAARLALAYRDRLVHAGWTARSAPSGRWEHWPCEVAIPDSLRHRCKRLEADGYLDSGVDPWTPAGEAELAAHLFAPLPGQDSLLPLLFLDIYEWRSDVRRAYPEAHLDPRRFLRWISAYGAHECGLEPLLDRYRWTVPSRQQLQPLLDLCAEHPELTAGLAAPAGVDRPLFVERLRGGGQPVLAERLAHGEFELPVATPLAFLRDLWSERSDLRARFPDPLGDDADALAAWLADEGRRAFALPAEIAAALERVAGGRYLDRIAAWCRRHPTAVEGWPPPSGEEAAAFARQLLLARSSSSEYSLDDVVAYLWAASAPEIATGNGSTRQISRQ